MFKGKLTYTLAALAVFYGFVGIFMGWLETSEGLRIVWIGLAAFGIRRAMPVVR